MRLPLLFALALPLPALAQEPPVASAPVAAAPEQPVEAAPVQAPPVAAPPVAAPPAAAPEQVADVDGWHVVTLGDKRLPDGRPTAEACGWERDVVVERVGATKVGADLKRGVLAVPCATEGGVLVAGKPSIRLVETAAVTPIRDEDVQRVIEKNERAIAGCQKRDPAGRGLLQVKWLVAPDGTTREVTALGGAMQSAGIRDCVVAEIKTWRFPTHAVQAGVPVDFSFGFDGPNSPIVSEPGAPRCKPDEKPKAEKDLADGEVACLEVHARPCAQGEVPLRKEQLAPGQLACVEVDSDRGVPFLKGELTSFGDVQLTNVKSSFGVGIGVAAIDGVYYAQLRPDVNVHYGPFSLGLGAPLRFEVADLSALNPNTVPDDVFGNAGRFRTEDWDQIEDFLRPIRYLSYGRKEDRVYVDINRVHSVTLGHGQLVRRYTPNVDIDEDRLIAAVDGYTDFGGVELLAGPFPVPRVVGGLVFVKPLGAFSDDVLAKSWSIGGTYVTDLNAPTSLTTRLNPADQRVQLAVDATNQLVWDGRNNPVGDVVQGVGVDTELKVLKLENLDIKTYADYSHLFFPAGGGIDSFDGGGFALGGLMRASFGKTPVRAIADETEDVRAGRAPREMQAGHALRFRLEARTFDPRYLPSYFNTLYEIDRLQYGIADRAKRATLPTKIGFLASQADEPWRAGFYTELSYAWVDILGVTAVYEDAAALGPGAPVRARNFALHAETSGFGFLQLFATYHYRNFEDFDGAFTFATDNEILYAGGRLELLPFLFVNAAAQRSFRVGFDDDDLARQVDAKGLRHSSIGFENVWSGAFDVELGWQF